MARVFDPIGFADGSVKPPYAADPAAIVNCPRFPVNIPGGNEDMDESLLLPRRSGRKIKDISLISRSRRTNGAGVDSCAWNGDKEFSVASRVARRPCMGTGLPIWSRMFCAFKVTDTLK
jgi:hypothetical protein